MRLINADDIVYESIDSSDICRHESYYGTGILVVRKEDIDVMPTIEPERKIGKWIPCSERLPIDAGHYLCSFEKPNRIDHIHVDLAYWTGGRWYGYRADAICAWMPLPEPYQGGENDETD